MSTTSFFHFFNFTNMGNVEHTPGPWKADVLIIFTDDTDVAEAIEGPSGRANARLISAAPELLEALKFCLSAIEDQGVFDASEKMAVTKALAAITKATGQTQEGAK